MGQWHVGGETWSIEVGGRVCSGTWWGEVGVQGLVGQVQRLESAQREMGTMGGFRGGRDLMGCLSVVLVSYTSIS